MEVAAIVLTLQATVVNRLAGVDYPTWTPRTPPLIRKRQRDDSHCAVAVCHRPARFSSAAVGGIETSVKRTSCV
jgi:hypothetical protein